MMGSFAGAESVAERCPESVWGGADYHIVGGLYASSFHRFPFWQRARFNFRCSASNCTNGIRPHVHSELRRTYRTQSARFRFRYKFTAPLDSS
ncbi:hypothetical protein BS50DRAFT_121959 [Corynespora cassiicola Philippines]|uniref:Uncharacterized protein n=1 Tax=Corynespora cassiicola Philippines TaxID=1448308 RepID=A0A2T2NAU8_CORCC|nr:hypothetical protein BS50DRAFT_121959 [Corynespora cassiicola Philippines]